MLIAAIVTLLIATALGYSWRSGEMILHRPYNDRHNDASAARQDYLG